MCKMITISLAQRADIVNLDSCCLYTNREVANSAALIAYIARCVSLLNNHQMEDVLSFLVDGKIDIND